MLQFHKSDPASTTSTQISPSSIQTNLNKTIQKPPRNSSTPPNRPRNFENTQPINNRNDASPHKEPTQGNVATSNIYHRQNKNSFKSNSVYTPLSQNYPQNNSFLNYDPLNQSQQQQANHDNSTYISKEAINKNESSSIYSNLPHSHIMNYSDIIQNNSFINDADTSKSARRYEQVKQDHTKPFQSSITPIQNKRPSHTPIQSTNPTGMHTNETLYTPAVTEGRSKSPEIFGAGERHSTKSKKSGISVTPTRLTPQNEQKLSTSAIKQRINQLKYQKEKQDSSPVPRSKSIQRLSPFKKNETLSSIKNTEQDRKIVWDDSKKDERIVITSVTEETKSRIMNWLYSITLIKENVSGIEKKLPRICRDGVIFIDLLNRLEGKHETIKGVNRKPENKTHVIANYQKLNNFLGKFEKMNPRYLWAHDYLMQSNEDVFWGFLDDIWHLYNKKVSPYDPRFNRDDRRATLRLQTSTHSAFKDGQKSRRSQLDVSYNDICYYDKSKLNSSYFNTTSPVHTKSRSRSRSRSPSENGGYDKLNHSFRSKKNEGTSHLIIDNSLGNYETNGRGSKYDQNQVNAGYQNRYSKRNNMVRSPSQGKFKSIIKKGDASKFFSRSFTESEYDETSTLAAANSISIEGENQVFEWLKTMGFKAMLMRDRSSLFEDPFRNGTLLCYVLGRIENERMHSIYKDPKSIDECRHNVYQAFQVLVRKQTPIPTYLKGKEEAVLKGDRNILLTLLYSIMKINENRVGLNTSVITNTNTDKIYKQEASYIPPYDDNETEQLEASLITWLTCLGILQEFSVKPQSMKELAIHFRNGVILCDLTAIVTNSRLITIHRKPTSELQCMTNIRKALEILRGKKMMAQRYLWREKDIYTGNKYILLGLLEDLHRFFDGLPPRTNPNYFLEGPYIPKRDDNLTQKLKEHRQSFGRIEGGIQPRSSTRIQSPTRSFLIGGSYNSRRGSRDAETKFQDTNRTKVREYQNSKLNLSSDEPISIIDYEKKAKSSPVKQHIDGYMSSNLSRWDSYHENGIYKSPKSDMRKVEFPLNSAKFSVNFFYI